MRVHIQVSTGEPCPKKEERAWDWVTKQCDNLTDCIYCIIEEEGRGFTIEDDNGKVIAEHIETYCH